MKSLAVVVVLCACNGGGSGHTTDVQPTLTLADRSDAEITRLVGAAFGFDMVAADTVMAALAPPCPAVSTDGTDTHFQGGCTTANGQMIAGSASATLSTGAIIANAFVLGDATGTTELDGSATHSAQLSTDADLTYTTAGIGVRSDLEIDCTPLPGCDNECTQQCSVTDSGLELVGAGGVLVSGSWTYDTMLAPVLVEASATLQGTDTLEISNDTTHAGCLAWSVGDRRGTVPCPI